MSTNRSGDLRRLIARPEEVRTAVLYTVFASGYLLVAAVRIGVVARGIYRYGEDPAEYAMFPGLLFLVVLGLWTGAVVLFSGDSHGSTVVGWLGLLGAGFSALNFGVLGTGRAELPGYPSTLIQGITAGGVVVCLLLWPVAHQEAIRRWQRNQEQVTAAATSAAVTAAPQAHLTRHSPLRQPDQQRVGASGARGVRLPLDD